MEDGNYLLTYSNFEGYPNYKWFESEDEIREFIDCNSIKVIECMRIIMSEDLTEEYETK